MYSSNFSFKYSPSAIRRITPTMPHAVLCDALQTNKLILFIGSGVTLNAVRENKREICDAYTWNGVIQHGLKEVVRLKHTAARELAELSIKQLNESSADPTQVADGISKHLNLSEQRHCWKSLFDPLKGDKSLVTNADILHTIHQLRKQGAKLVTTNYDTLLETSGRPDHINPLVVEEKDLDVLIQWLDGELLDYECVFHPHGVYTKPETMVFDQLSYQRIINHARGQSILQSMFVGKIILFIGCSIVGGLQDTNIGPLLELAKATRGQGNSNCYLLMPDINGASSEVKKAVQNPWVNILYYGADRDKDLVPFLQGLFNCKLNPINNVHSG